MFDVNANLDLLDSCFSQFQMDWYIYEKMYWYYMGLTDTNRRHEFIDDFTDDLTDSQAAYSFVNDRYNHKVSTNYIKKFVKEEVSYSVGIDVTYISRSGNEDIITAIQNNLAHWSADADINLCKNMLIYSTAYELYYLDENAQFCSKVVSPRHGYAYTDDNGNIIFFMHVFRKQFDTNICIDIYTKDEIIHCNEVFDEIADRDANVFGVVPVGVAQLSEEGWLDTIYNDIKSLQDAYETNLSDISQEITEFRNAYLWLNNIAIKDDDLPEMKRKGVMQTKGNSGQAQWLIKNINDTFIQNTLNTLEDKMYQMSAHINNHEKMQSNTSSLALRARLISLEEKCKLNQKALANCIKTRLQMLFIYINSLKGTNYDYKDIKTKFTPNIPSDDMVNAQIIAQLGDKLSIETGLAQLSFVENPKEELAKIKQESQDVILGSILLGGGSPPVGGDGSGEQDQSELPENN